MTTTMQCQNASFRADMYLLLAALFRQEPSAELKQFIANIQVSSEDKPLAPLHQSFVDLQGVAKTTELSLLSEQYFSLFIGLAEGEVSLYAGWYREQKLMSSTLLDLRNHLQRIGICRAEHIKEPEDHISALCEVMAILIQEDTQHQQMVFFERYLASWYTTFCRALISNQRSEFYLQAGRLLQLFLEQEQAMFEQLKLVVSNT